MVRVRFAPSPTGFLHIGSARTFIFNWLYARHHNGTVVLRIDDTDVDRNTDASLVSIFEGLAWLGLGDKWGCNEDYRQSQRLHIYVEMANRIFENGLAYRDFTPASVPEERLFDGGPWLFNPEMRALSRDDSDRRANAGEPFVLRFRVPRERSGPIEFQDEVYGHQSKLPSDIEDFALLRSNRFPTYHLASCSDDVKLKISHIIRGQDHLTNTFKHILIFEALGAAVPKFAHLPLLLAPDGSKLSKRRHGPVVSVTTYRDRGFLPQAFINFLCLLGWSPKDNREQMTLQELVDAFSFEGIQRHNAVLNFTDTDPIDPKALWLNAEYIRTVPVEELAAKLMDVVWGEGFRVQLPKLVRITGLMQERIKTLREIVTLGDFFFLNELRPYDSSELIPQKGDAAMAWNALLRAREILRTTEFSHDALDSALRAAAAELKIKTGQMFQPIRVAVCGRKAAPPLFETLEVLGRETCLRRIDRAIDLILPLPELT